MEEINYEAFLYDLEVEERNATRKIPLKPTPKVEILTGAIKFWGNSILCTR